jgi:hypothetical protein
VLNEKMILNNKQEVVTTYFKSLPWNSPGQAEESLRKAETWPEFQSCTS